MRVFLLIMFWLSGWLATVAFDNADELLLRISSQSTGQTSMLQLKWTGVPGTEDFVMTSSDLQIWRLQPLMIVGNGAEFNREIETPGTTMFYRILRQATATLPWVTPAAATPLVDYQLFFSEAIQAPTNYHIYLPPAYSMQPQRRFPVIYWLHGSGGGVMAIPALAQYFHNAIQARKMPPVIVVFPNGLPNGMWCDSKDGVQPLETLVIHELIPYIDRNYRTIAERSGRMAEGFSMGGYGAARFGLKFPEIFRAVSMIGAGPLQLDFLEEHPRLVPIESRRVIFAEVFGNDMDYFEAQGPLRLAEVAAENLPEDFTIRQIVGTRDSMLLDNRRLHERFTELGIPHEYTELFDVGHNALDVFSALGALNFDFYNRILHPIP